MIGSHWELSPESAAVCRIVENQIKIDVVDYFKTLPKYKKLIVFIYDKSGSVQEHSITEQTLEQIDQIEDIIIVSEPSNVKDRKATCCVDAALLLHR